MQLINYLSIILSSIHDIEFGRNKKINKICYSTDLKNSFSSTFRELRNFYSEYFYKSKFLEIIKQKKLLFQQFHQDKKKINNY